MAWKRIFCLGAVLRYQQGFAFAPFGVTSQSTVFPFTNFFLVEPEGKRRLDNIFTLDLKVEKEFPLKEYGSFDLILETFNLTNANPVLARNSFVGRILEDSTLEPEPTLGMIQRVLSPRVLRLGLRYSF